MGQLQAPPAQKSLQHPLPSVHAAPIGAQTHAWSLQLPLQQSEFELQDLLVPRQTHTPLTDPHAPVQQLWGIV